MTVKDFKSEHNLPYDLTRSIGEMTALFGLQYNPASMNTIKILLENNSVFAVYEDEYGNHMSSQPYKIMLDVSGEYLRCVKLALLNLCKKIARNKKISLPWGILTGVRPGKLAYKLLNTYGEKTIVENLLVKNYLLKEENAKLLTDICALQKSLVPDDEKQVGIYIHIPFCASKCTYCSFPTGIVPNNEIEQQNFLNLIEQDMLAVVQLLSMHNLNVTTLYIGGGTPTSLSDSVFARLLQITAKYFLTDAIREFTVEAGRPDTFSYNKLVMMETYGVTRVSVNPQTMHDKTLKIIGRQHTVADFYNVFEQVRKSSINNINADLILGLPNENVLDMKFSCDEIAKLAPENLTVHTLALKRSAALFNEAKNILENEEIEDLINYSMEAAKKLLMRPYYLYRQHYMLGNFANIGYSQSGKECLYNIQMMEERNVVIGIGAGSSTKLPRDDGYSLLKLNMPKNISSYQNSLSQLIDKRAKLFEIGRESKC